MATSSLNKLLARLENVSGVNGSFKASCPAHDDLNPSLSISPGEDGRILLHCHTGCSPDAILEAIGLGWSDLFPNSPEGGQEKRSCPNPGSGQLRGDWPPSAAEPVPKSRASQAEPPPEQFGRPSHEYVYQNAEGEPIGRVHRWDLPGGQKRFRPSARKSGRWQTGWPESPIPLYRLPELANESTVYIVEGEKCVEAARSIGLTATTSLGGSSGPRKSDWISLAGKNCIICPDNDGPGEKYAAKVAEILNELDPAAQVRVLRLPELRPKDDIADFIAERRATGRANEEIRAEIESLPTDAGSPLRACSGNLRLRPFSEVERRPVDWIWPNWLARGKFILFAGDPGLGKSLVSTDLAARISKPGIWPDGNTNTLPPGDVVFLSAEDDIHDTIRPRLEAAEADLDRVQLVERTTESAERSEPDPAWISLEDDIGNLDMALSTATNPTLLVIDPLPSFFRRTNDYKNAELRKALTPLLELARKHSISILAVTHLNKNQNQCSQYRTSGSIAYTALARIAWTLVKDPQDPESRILYCSKSNLGIPGTGFRFRVSGGPASQDCRLEWDECPVDLELDEALRSQLEWSEGPNSKIETATEFLRMLLSDQGLASSEVIERGKASGHAEKTLRRAFSRLGGKPAKKGMEGGWEWSLPPEGESSPEDKLSKTASGPPVEFSG